MPLPYPEAGLVIHFNYLWRREQEQGRDNARYPRPCAIVIAYRRGSDGATIAVVVPITHSQPDAATRALPLPPAVKRQLGLDEAPSWVIVDEANEFVWPGFDLQPNAEGSFAYGHLPPRFFSQVRAAVLEGARSGRLGRVPR